MRKLILLIFALFIPLYPASNLSKRFKLVNKSIGAVEKQLVAYVKQQPPYEVRNLISLTRTHISLMAAGTTAAAPGYANREFEIKKHLNTASKTLFTTIRDAAQKLNPQTQLLGGATISFEAETYLAGVIELLRQELEKKQPTRTAVRSGRKPMASVKKLHKQGIKEIKKGAKKLSANDKKLIAGEGGLIDTHQALQHLKAQKGSIGPNASNELSQKIHQLANYEIELFMHLSNDAKELFRTIRDYAQKIAAEDPFVGGLSPKAKDFLDSVKRRL